MTKILSACMYSIEKDKQIREVFLEFTYLEGIAGETIGQAILRFFKEKGTDRYITQYYHWAANMQSLKKVLKAKFQKNKKVCYTSKRMLYFKTYVIIQNVCYASKTCVIHCCPQNFNLRIASTYKISIVANLLIFYKCLMIYFNTSPKRENLPLHIINLQCYSPEWKRAPSKNQPHTRTLYLRKSRPPKKQTCWKTRTSKAENIAIFLKSNERQC